MAQPPSQTVGNLFAHSRLVVFGRRFKYAFSNRTDSSRQVAGSRVYVFSSFLSEQRQRIVFMSGRITIFMGRKTAVFAKQINMKWMR